MDNNQNKRYSRQQIELIAEHLLQRYRQEKGQSLTYPIDIDYFIEHILNLSIEYRPIAALQTDIVLARYTPSRHLIQINEEQLQLFETTSNLERTVKGHEAGHSVLHPSGEDHSYLRKITIKNSPEEREAHRFGAYLLVPKKELLAVANNYDFKGWNSFYRIVDDFKVTKQLMKIRLKEVGLFSENNDGEFISKNGFNYGKL